MPVLARPMLVRQNAMRFEDDWDLEEEPSGGSPELLSFSSFKSRTSLRWSARSDDTKRVDDAYEAYIRLARDCPDLSAPCMRTLSINLLEALNAMLAAKGGTWSTVKRNVASEGLLEAWHVFLTDAWGEVLVAQTRRERSAVAWEVTRSRFGVAYLLGNTQYELDWAYFLGGVADVGGAVAAGAFAGVGGSLAAASESHVGDIATRLGKFGVKSGEVISGGQAVFGVAQKGVATPAGYLNRMKANPDYVAPEIYTPQFRVTSRLIDELKLLDDSTDVSLAGSMAKGAMGMTVLTVGVVEGIVELGATLATAIRSAVSRAIDWWHDRCLQDSTFKTRIAGKTLRKIIEFIITKVSEAAAPFVGGASNLASGIVDTVDKVIERTSLWWNKRQVRINSGHFELISKSIEHEVDLAIGNGLFHALKGAGDIAANAFLPGAGSLVSMIMTALEWGYKLIDRLLQKSRLGAFTIDAENLWLREAGIARTEALKGGGDYNPNRPTFEPSRDPSSGSIIHKPDEFKEFFQKGCSSSVVVPMLTLNSGMCGSLSEQIEMHAGNRRIDQSTFDAGIRYFTRLKKVSTRTLKASGFKFSSPNRSINGTLIHAVRDHSDASRGDQIVAALGGD